jgi:probable O-glycosylation ligase (exosortase A-associated)
MRGGLADAELRPAAPQLLSPVVSQPVDGLRPGEVGDAFVEASGSYRNLRWTLGYIGILAYVCVITTYALPIGDLAVAAALVGVILQRESLRFPRPLVLFVLLLGWIAAGYTQSRYPDYVREELINFVKLGLVLLAAFNVLRTRSQLRFFMIFWLGCFALYPMRGTYVNYFMAGYTRFGRALWNFIYSNSNDLAALTLLFLAMAVGVLVAEPKGWFKRAAFLGVFLLTLLIFLTQSRGGILGLAVFGLFALAGYRHKLRSLALGVAAVLVVATFAPPSVWARLRGLARATDTENLRAVDKEGSAQQRWQIWQTAFEIIRDYPLTGVGWGAYSQANAAYAPLTGGADVRLGARDAHSTYFGVLAETGYPGLFLFLALVLGTALEVDRIRRRHKDLMPKTAMQLYFMEVGLLGYLVCGIFGSFERISFFYLHLVLMWALAKALESDAQALQALPQPTGSPNPSTVLAGGA